VPGTGPFRNGATTPTSYADFDQSYDPINGLNYESTSSRYTVTEGDTLEGIASKLWGDASFWYMLADANGLSSSDALVSGMRLIVPNKVHNAHNSADTWRVYDPNEAVGDLGLSPYAPKPPKKHGCGVLGAILMVAVAVAVTVATAGAAAAAMAAAPTTLGGGIGLVLGGSLASTAGIGIGGAIAIGAGAAAVGSVVSQGVGIAIGAQDKFSWKGVAMSAIAGGVTDVIVDLRGVTSLDRPMLQVLFRALIRMGQDCRLSLVRPGAQVWERFEAAGLDRGFSTFADINAALASVPNRTSQNPLRPGQFHTATFRGLR